MSHEKEDERFGKTNFCMLFNRGSVWVYRRWERGVSSVEKAQSAETTAIKLIFSSIKASFNPSITIYVKLCQIAHISLSA